MKLLPKAIRSVIAALQTLFLITCPQGRVNGSLIFVIYVLNFYKVYFDRCTVNTWIILVYLLFLSMEHL